MKLLTSSLLSFVIVLVLCSSSCENGSGSQGDGIIEVTLLQLNDVYEIAPLEGGKVGGLARVATLRKKLLAENPNVMTVIAGDFLNPSLIGSMKHEGSRIKGKQMIEVLNEMGLDLATFGNHEFDLKLKDLQSRIDESKFMWVSSNIRMITETDTVPFAKKSEAAEQVIPKTVFLDFIDEDGTQLRMGLFSVCLPFNKKEYVHYDDVQQSTIESIDSLKGNCDFIVGLTHLDMADDVHLSNTYSEVSLIMGGHDHNNMIDSSGHAIVAKADANAKTVYVHRLKYNKKTKELNINSELVNINESIPSDERVGKTVAKWTAIADKSFRDMGFDPNQVLLEIGEPLEGRETVLRHQQTNLGSLIAKSMSAACEKSQCAIVNSGSIRVDDQISGAITQYDILRTLPFGGGIVEVDIKGDLLRKILNIGLTNKGKGGYLQWDKITRDESKNQWAINGKWLSDIATYRVALSSFLLTGGESGLDFLTPENPGILNVYRADGKNDEDLRNDIRMAVISYIRYGGR